MSNLARSPVLKRRTTLSMGLFGKTQAPVALPPIRRADIAAAVAATTPEEQVALTQGALGGALLEIEYLTGLLPQDERVVALARCVPSTTIGIWSGVIVLTPRRLVSVFAQHKKTQMLGEPTVTVLHFSDLVDISFLADKYLRIGYFDLRDGTRVTLSVGWSREWTIQFMNMAKQALNRSKF